MSARPLLLAEMLERALVAERLEGAGLVPPDAHELSGLFEQCARTLQRVAGGAEDEAVCAVFVPGRIEVLGKHTDYAGGRSLLTALGRGFCMIGSPRRDGRVVLHDAAGRGWHEVATGPVQPDPRVAWAKYPATVVRRLREDFPDAERGADLAFASNLPSAAGMSSSSAFVTATFLVLSALNRLEETSIFSQALPGREELADYLGAVENGRPFRGLAGVGAGVGTRGGSEDHVAILCARPGSIVQYAFRPVRHERTLAIPEGCTFAVASSGVRASKGGAAGARFNRISDRAGKLEELWARGTGADAGCSLGDILASAPDAGDRLRELVRKKGSARDLALLERLEQFAMESYEIIPAAGDALAASNLPGFGVHVDRSQRLAERMLHNQVEETIYLQRAARESGAHGASAFGAGFGGSVWALIRDEDAPAFLDQWRRRYLTRFPRRRDASVFMLAPPGPPAVRLC